MSDSEHSSVTYTSVPSPAEDYSDIGSPEVDGPPSPDYVPGSEEPEQAPLSLDYVPGSEEPEQAPPSHVYLPYVPKLVYPEYMPPEDNVFPAEEQPLPVAATPTANSPGYILEFEPKGDPKEDDEEDPKEDPADYHADSTVVALPAVDHVPFKKVTEPLLQIPSTPLPIPSPPPNSPTHIEILECCLPLWKRLRFASPTPSQEVEESSATSAARVYVAPRRPMSRELDYGITDTWDELVGDIEEIVPTTLQGVNQRVTDLSTIVEQETTIMYGIMEDAQDDREREARMARKAWGLSMDASDNARSDFMSLRTTLVVQHALILDLQAADRRRQRVIKELLAADHKRQGVTATLAACDANRNGDDSHTSGMGRPMQVSRECTYPDFLKCQPLNFKGTEGVVGLSQWTLKKMMTNKYCPRGEIKKLKSEMWNLKVKGTDVVAYSQRFQELALMCDQIFLKEIDKVERYVDGLPDTIHGSVMATKPKTMQDAIEFATELMNRKINTWAEREHAKGLDLCVPNVTVTMTVLVLPNATIATDLVIYLMNGEIPPNVNTGANQRGKVCFECGAQGNFKKECPKLKNNNNQGNQVRNAKVQAKVYAVGKAGANPDNNVVTGTFLLNNHYASVLFDTGADRSFVSTAFSSRIVITPTALDHDYNVELADERIVGLNTIIRGCTLNFLNHPFNIDLISLELGSFDVIIGIDWLAKYHAVIICAEKIVRIPFGDEILIVRGDGSSNKHGTRLNIISYTKDQEYLTKGCHVFLENITATKDEDKSKGKRLEDLPVV
nr:reverse transcriptase domain-containing protein [Tanacetum cinerariifolium]